MMHMTQTTRRGFFALGAAAGTTFLAGCSSSGTGSDAGTSSASAAASSGSSDFSPKLDTNTSATITVISNYQNFEALDAAGTSFQEYYPNVTVVHEHLDDFETNVEQRVTSDPTVGLIFMGAFHLDNRPNLLAGLLDIASADADIDLSAVDENTYKSCYVDGKLPYVPIWLKEYGMSVNKTLLEKEGLSVPQTYADFCTCCDSLIAKGYVPLQGHPSNIQYFFLPYAMNYLQNKCTAEQFAAIREGTEGAGAAIEDVFKLVLEMKDKGYYTKESMDTYADYYDKAILKFFEGNAPFLAAHTNTVSGMKKRETKSEAFQANPFEYEFVYAPLGEKYPYSYSDTDYGFGINANCEYLDMAKEFYRFCYTDKILNQFSEIKGIPSTAKVPTNEIYANLPTLPDDYTCYAWDFDDPTRIVEYSVADTANSILVNESTTTEEAIATLSTLAKARAAEESA